MRRLPPLLAPMLALAASGLARAEPIPFKQEAAAGASLPGGALGVLLVSAVAIAAVFWIRKRLNLQPLGKGVPRHVRVLETQRLGPQALLSVVEFAGGQYLIAQGAHGITCLAKAPADAAADAAADATTGLPARPDGMPAGAEHP